MKHSDLNETALVIRKTENLQGRPMTTLANLTARKQQLLERLQEYPGPHERDEIERLLIEIDAALDMLEETVPAESHDEQ